MFHSKIIWMSFAPLPIERQCYVIGQGEVSFVQEIFLSVSEMAMELVLEHVSSIWRALIYMYRNLILNLSCLHLFVHSIHFIRSFNFVHSISFVRCRSISFDFVLSISFVQFRSISFVRFRSFDFVRFRSIAFHFIRFRSISFNLVHKIIPSVEQSSPGLGKLLSIRRPKTTNTFWQQSIYNMPYIRFSTNTSSAAFMMTSATFGSRPNSWLTAAAAFFSMARALMTAIYKRNHLTVSLTGKNDGMILLY